VYFTKFPNGNASRVSNDIEVFGSRFLRPPMPHDIRCCKQSKNDCCIWKTSATGFPKSKQSIVLANIEIAIEICTSSEQVHMSVSNQTQNLIWKAKQTRNASLIEEN